MNKKKQKNFIHLGRSGFAVAGSVWWFAAFFKKTAAFFVQHIGL
ncbi:MAG TPA: hypothetical protein VL356_08105 [Acidocella sp.]|nr:hypothetical protein [Acidocella sp.]